MKDGEIGRANFFIDIDYPSKVPECMGQTLIDACMAEMSSWLIK